MPGDYIGSQVDVRADSGLVKIYHRGQLIKTHPRMRPGARSTDASDLPEHKSAYALRDITHLIGLCAGHGENIGIYAERILDDPQPWTRMRAVYRLIGLVRQYGPAAVEAACAKALDLDVIAVGKIASMLAKAVENTPALMPVPAPAGASRFARDPAEYANHAARPATAAAVAAVAAHPAKAGTTLASVGTGGTANQGTSVANAGTTLANAGTTLASVGTGETASSGTAGEIGVGAGPAYGRGVQLHLVFSHSEQTHTVQEEQR